MIQNNALKKRKNHLLPENQVANAPPAKKKKKGAYRLNNNKIVGVWVFLGNKELH